MQYELPGVTWSLVHISCLKNTMVGNRDWAKLGFLMFWYNSIFPLLYFLFPSIRKWIQLQEKQERMSTTGTGTSPWWKNSETWTMKTWGGCGSHEKTCLKSVSNVWLCSDAKKQVYQDNPVEYRSILSYHPKGVSCQWSYYIWTNHNEVAKSGDIMMEMKSALEIWRSVIPCQWRGSTSH